MTEATMAFLRHLRAGGPWQLSAIALDGSIETKTFFNAGTAAVMLDWVEQRDGRCNLYFLVNVSRGGKRPSREEIARIDYLHCDIDPRDGELLKKEQERIRLLLTNNRPEGVPEPTCSIFSGGGYQALWKLREPIIIQGNLARAEDVERCNRHLANVLGGDTCGDITRLLRLPGTMNLPTPKKLELGRVPALADFLWFKPEVAYSLEDFMQAPPKTQTDPAPAANVTRLANIDELNGWHVSDRVKLVIERGHDPDAPKEGGDNSRSGWLFDVCCQLARDGVPDDVIFAVITDPAFKISASVIEKPNPDAYARRQVARAKEEVKEPALAELNARFFIIGSYGGRCVVAEEYHERNDEYASYGVQRRDDFCARFAHRRVEVGKRLMPLGRWWLDQPQARRYDRVVFAPGRYVGEDVFNLWRGFSVEPREGDCSLFLDHVRENVGREYSDWLISWMARAVQRPGERAEVAVVLQGGRGVGKSFFARQFGSLFGPHFLAISNPRHLIGNFNAHLEDCIVLLADEAFYAGDKRHGSVLKSLITENTLALEKKGYDLRQGANHLHIVMCSNEAWVVPAGLDERRFLVLEVAPTHQRDHEYFGRIAAQMDAGEREALLHLLLSRDLAGWDFRRAPDTESLTHQKILSQSPAGMAVYQMLATGSHPYSLVKGERVFVVTKDLAQEVGVSAHALGRELRSIADRQVREDIGGERRRGFWLPPLPEARARWMEARRYEGVHWPGDVAEWDGAEENKHEAF